MEVAADSSMAPLIGHENGDQFEAIEVEFDYTNDEWAKCCLPHVRLGVDFLKLDQTLLEEVIQRQLARDPGHLDEALDNLSQTSEHLRYLADLIDIALARVAVIQDKLDELGAESARPPQANTAAAAS